MGVENATDRDLAGAIHSARDTLNKAVRSAMEAGIEVRLSTSASECRISGLLEFVPCVYVEIKRPL